MADYKHITLSKRLVAVNSASTVGAKITNFLVMLWVYQYLLRRLPVDEFAVLPVVTSLMVFAPLFFSFFTGGVSRYAIDAYARGDFVEVRRIISSLFPVLLVAAGVFLPLGLLFAANIEKVFNFVPGMVADARIMMMLLLTSFTFQMLVIPFKTAYAIRQRYFEQSMLEVGRDILRASLMVLFLLLIEPRVFWVAVATFFSETLLTTILLVRSLRMVPELRIEWALFDPAKARELTGFGMWTTLGRLGSIMFTNAATLLLNLHGTSLDVTSYHIGATFFRQMQSTINLATIPLQPAITAMNALDDKKRLANTVMRGGRYALWLSLLVATPLMIYADAFVNLYLGPDYAIAAVIIVLFMSMMPFVHPSVLLPLTAIAKARVREFFLPAFLFPLAGLVLMTGLVRWLEWGAIGVTLSLVATTVVSQLGYFWRLCIRLAGIDAKAFGANVLCRGMFPALSGALAWAGLRLIAIPSSWEILIGYSVAGAVVYLAVLFAFCLSQGERTELRRAFERVKRS